jgi:hypothetical protein
MDSLLSRIPLKLFIQRTCSPNSAQSPVGKDGSHSEKEYSPRSRWGLNLRRTIFCCQDRPLDSGALRAAASASPLTGSPRSCIRCWDKGCPVNLTGPVEGEVHRTESQPGASPDQAIAHALSRGIRTPGFLPNCRQEGIEGRRRSTLLRRCLGMLS